MKVLTYFKYLEHGPILDEKIAQNSQKLQDLLPNLQEVKWTCWMANGAYFVEVSVHGPRVHFHARAEGKPLYLILDRVLEKIEKQALKRKASCKKHIRKRDNVIFLEPENAWSEHSDDFLDADGDDGDGGDREAS